MLRALVGNDLRDDGVEEIRPSKWGINPVRGTAAFRLQGSLMSQEVTVVVRLQDLLTAYIAECRNLGAPVKLHGV